MSRQVTTKASGRTFTVRDGESVLDGALREGVIIAYGCRSGACGSCKGRVLEGAVDPGSYEEHALPAGERAAGMALFCQARPLTDLVVDCREIAGADDVQIRRLPCRVQRLERIAPEVMLIRLKLPSNERLQFLAGQYIDILPKEGGRRSLSMANPPHDDELLELHLRNYGGPFSRHVFGRMKEKDILRFEGPLGTFFLREGGMKPILFVAGGTGFAPIKAMIEHAIQGRVERPMTLYRGCRARADCYMNDLAERWNADHGVRYVPVLSEPLPGDEWTGRTGLVHHAVIEDLPDLGEYQAYVCGSPAMVEAARRDFTTRCGLPVEEFYSDSFTPAGGFPRASQ
ncbi:MAG: CDP-6-deoxy-delta-3,4-glucoseen reductase [Burkholderiales bacterium]|nr:CDP-6-deoxy-delta-3,4-glucoseen reductase [Burkholderiales bacterium]